MPTSVLAAHISSQNELLQPERSAQWNSGNIGLAGRSVSGLACPTAWLTVPPGALGPPLRRPPSSLGASDACRFCESALKPPRRKHPNDGTLHNEHDISARV